MASVNPKPIRANPRLPDDKVSDIGKVRFGDASITGEYPIPRRPVPQIADTGKVRVGDATITGVYPLRR